MALTEQEAQLYDRQLRLWGVEAQQRLRKANVLLFGFTGVQAEICKNIALSGVSSITINDTEACTYKDLGANFFLEETDIGKNVSHRHTYDLTFAACRSGCGESQSPKSINQNYYIKIVLR